MNKLHKRRLYLIALFTIGLTLAVSLILYSLKQNINLFLTPNEIITQHIKANYAFRLGGMVKKGSLKRDAHGLGMQFVVTDFKQDLIVYYTGILPDLFREGKGVVAEGQLNAEGIFIANQVLAKHDENYMPKKVYEEMRRNSGRVRNDDGVQA